MNRCILSALLGVCCCFSQPGTPPGTGLARDAAKAKAEGKSEVVFSTSAGILPAYSRGLVHALAQYSAVVGVPEEKQTIVPDSESIATWYSVQIEEWLVKRLPVMGALLQLDALPAYIRPTLLMPQPQGRLLLFRLGGVVVFDGVTMNQRENNLTYLRMHDRYLFIIDATVAGVARLPLGDAGVFLIRPDDTLIPVTIEPHPISDDVIKGGFPTLSTIRDRAWALR